MGLEAWEISEDEKKLAAALAAEIEQYCTINPDSLKTYSGAIAIDGKNTKDRDDAIKISRTDKQVIIEVFIANPTRFIKKGDRLDELAQARKTSIYFTADNMPMLPRELSEDALSLNAGKLTPVIRVETKLNAKTGKIESIAYEQCFVEAENLTYEEVAEKISAGDKKLVGWNQISAWLKSIRAKNTKIPILPNYDPDTGVLTTEEGLMRIFSPQAANAYFIVAETMILANQACATLMRNCFEDGLGVYRIQKSISSPAQYAYQSKKHASLGVADYSHSTSPNRRYADFMVHRFLGALGNTFTLNLSAQVHDYPLFTPPYSRAELKEILQENNHHLEWQKTLYKDKRKKDGERWLAKVFPDTKPEQLRDFEPISFSILLKASAENGIINAIFANEVLQRIEAKGGNSGRSALIFPKDAVNLFRFAENCQGENYKIENAELWQNLREQVLKKLASDPQMLDIVFAEFTGKIGAKTHMPIASFFSMPKKTGATQTNQAYAAAIIMDYEHKHYTTAEFAIGYSPRPAETRAKIEFLRAFGAQTLREGEDPELPSQEKVYHVNNLYRENAAKRKGDLLKKGYEIREDSRPFEPNKESGIPRGYKYEAKILKDDKLVLSVTVRRDNAEDAERIGLETAIFALRKKGHIPENMFAHTGLATFTGRLKNGHGIAHGNAMVLSAKRTEIVDHESWLELMEVLKSKFILNIINEGKSVVITCKHGGRAESLKELADLISDALPKSTLIIQRDKVTIDNPPRLLKAMIADMAAQPKQR